MPIIRALLAALSLSAACVPARENLRGDHFFARGEYREAAAAYETALQDKSPGAQADRLLLQTSLAYLLVGEQRGGAEPDPAATATARKRLDELLARYPASDHRPLAIILTRLLQQLDRLQAARQAHRAQLAALEADAGSNREQIETLQGALDAQEQRLSTANAEAEQHASDVEQLQAKIARQSRQIDELTGALDALKRIDMQRTR